MSRQTSKVEAKFMSSPLSAIQSIIIPYSNSTPATSIPLPKMEANDAVPSLEAKSTRNRTMVYNMTLVMSLVIRCSRLRKSSLQITSTFFQYRSAQFPSSIDHMVESAHTMRLLPHSMFSYSSDEVSRTRLEEFQILF